MKTSHTRKNMELALRAACDMRDMIARGVAGAEIDQIRNDIDYWVGYWDDAPGGRRALRWPHEIMVRAGLT